MTIFLDTTALVAAHLDGSDSTVVTEALVTETDWCASATAICEAEILIERMDLRTADRNRIRNQLLTDWQMFHIVPVDAECLIRAAEIGREQPVRTIDAIHLASADRLPGVIRYVTFDSNQIGPALALGFDLVSALSVS